MRANTTYGVSKSIIFFTFQGDGALFVKSFVFAPDLLIRIDYSAKYVDLSQGTLAGLLTGWSVTRFCTNSTRQYIKFSVTDLSYVGVSSPNSLERLEITTQLKLEFVHCEAHEV